MKAREWFEKDLMLNIMQPNRSVLDKNQQYTNQGQYLFAFGLLFCLCKYTGHPTAPWGFSCLSTIAGSRFELI